MSGFINLINEYSYLTLFLALMLELICIPIPNEALMSYVGLLSFHGKMNLILSLLTAGAGGVLGVTISYWIGYKLGAPFFRKFGRYIHMGPEKMDRVSKWYGKYGKILLIFSYFIPGIRHIASLISGVIRLPFRSFSVFSYIGVFLWTGTFISLGYILGPQWDKYQGEIKKWLVLASLVMGLVLICYLVIKANRPFIRESLTLLFQWSFKRYKSFLKIKLIILLALILFISLSVLMIGMIQDFISNDFSSFNTVSRSIIFFLFNIHWQPIMNDFYSMASPITLSLISIFTLITILINNINKWLESLFFVVTLIGGFLFTVGVRWIFRFMFSGWSISTDFPNGQSMIFIIVCGFFLVMLIRHQKNYFFSTITFFLFAFFLLAFFISRIYVVHSNPSDLLAGYVFGAVWASGMILSLELFRFLSQIKKY
ncbi:MAG: VTT domain-containing protein [Sporolactobacillus sp.]